MIELNIQTISVNEFKQRYDEIPDLCLIDVRETDEWQLSRIPRAIHIPKSDIATDIQSHVSDKKCPIYLHCKGGVRSLHAAETLSQLGYQTVYSIAGGITAWANAGYPVVS
jgi:rhodanese-related sulfurtransferase